MSAAARGGATGRGPRRGARLLRSPAWLYRCRLGWLLGRRFLLLTHRGRRTGRVRQTVIEVVRYDAVRREATVVSAWGSRADWWRNLQARPALAVQIGGRRYPRPRQRALPVTERDALLRRYWRDHRLAARAVAAVFHWPRSPAAEGWPAFVASVEAITFHLDAAPGVHAEGSQADAHAGH